MAEGLSFRLVEQQADFKVAPGVWVLDRYRLERLCGMGGTANVWLASVGHTQNKVAIKIQNPGQHTGAHRSERLEREFQLLNLVCSPHVVAVIDYGTLPDGRAAVAFEFMEGQTLREAMEEHDTFDLTTALDLTAQLLRALHDVHVQGIVHRDIKPDNIMVQTQPDGTRRLKIFDFGIAKVTSEDVRLMAGLADMEIAELLMPLTSPEMTVGTPEYMAPEQISATDIGPHTDIYAAGIVMYEMLFGEVPYTGKNFFEIAHKHLAGILPPLPADLPNTVHKLIWKSLSCRVEERYPGAEEMLRDLDATLANADLSRWDAVHDAQDQALEAFMADDMMSTWTHMSDDGLEVLKDESGVQPDVSPDAWLQDVAVTNQVVALGSLEAWNETPRPEPTMDESEDAPVIWSSVPEPAEDRQQLGRRVTLAEPGIAPRGFTKSPANAPWNLPPTPPARHHPPTLELSLTDKLAVLSDRRDLEEEEEDNAPTQPQAPVRHPTTREPTLDKFEAAPTQILPKAQRRKTTQLWQASFLRW